MNKRICKDHEGNCKKNLRDVNDQAASDQIHPLNDKSNSKDTGYTMLQDYINSDQFNQKKEPDVSTKQNNETRCSFSPIGHFVTDTNGIIISIKLFFNSSRGFTEEQWINQSITDLILPEHHELYLRYRDQVLKTKSEHDCELQLTLENDLTFWALLQTKPICDENNEVIRLQSVITDITQYKFEQQNIQISQDLARSAIDSLSAHIAILNSQGNIISVNRAWRIFQENNNGSSGSMSENANYLDVCDRASGAFSEGAAEFAQGIRDVISGRKKNFQMEYPCHSPTENRWFIGNVTAINHIENNYVVISHEDITERKLAEIETSNRKEVLSQIINNIPHSVFWKDRDCIYRGCNTNFAEKAGLNNPEEIVGKTDYELAWSQEEAEFYRECDEEVMENGEPMLDFDETQLRADGKETYIRTSKVPLRDHNQTVTGILGMFIDVTESINAQKELLAAHENLKQTQGHLVQNEKMASIGQLAAGVAHEINNPVGFVASNFEALQKYMMKFLGLLALYENLTDQVKAGNKERRLHMMKTIEEEREQMDFDFILEDLKEVFDESNEGIRRITEIVQNLRDFSRIDQVDNFGEYNLNEGLNSTLLVAKNELKYHCDIVKEFNDIPIITCNSGQVNQVFLNIMVNAAQAIKGQERESKGKITIQTLAEQDYIICKISDDGPGIDADKLNKIFDPFFTTKPVGQGTGLGLSVSYDIIVNKHKGDLIVESTPGSGTTFTIKLPIKQVCKEKKISQENEKLLETVV